MEIIYWNDKVEKLINDLEVSTASRVLKMLDLLEEYGNFLGMPDSKSLGKGLFELRIRGKIQIRVIYIFHKNKVFIVHGLVKRCGK